jgi:hypothetical protein
VAEWLSGYVGLLVTGLVRGVARQEDVKIGRRQEAGGRKMSRKEGSKEGRKEGRKEATGIGRCWKV